MQETSFIYDMAIALLAALVGGSLAMRLNLPVVIGYMVAGMAVGPFTPGPSGGVEEIGALAEIGVVLLMFGVGVEFSLDQLRTVRSIALIGGGLQTILTIAFGVGFGTLLGWPWGWSIFFGCILSLSSTTVLLKVLMERGEMGSEHGQIMVGISLVQDLSTILMVALLPALTLLEPGTNPLVAIGRSLLQTAIFLGVMFLLGARLFPWLLMSIAQRGSRELFLLSTVSLSIGTAFVATTIFGLSLALGAFIAGIVISESELHYRIMGELLPVRDIFAVVFFVSIGMLIDPIFLWENIGVVFLVSLAIIFGKLIINILVTLPFQFSRRTLFLAAAGLAQIGEFSFILAQQGIQLGVLDSYVSNLTLSGALISILVSPFLMKVVEQPGAWLDQKLGQRHDPDCEPLEVTTEIKDHVVICGYGRVGTHIVESLTELGCPFVVIEQDWRRAQQARNDGALVIYGDATNLVVLEGAQLTTAKVVVVAVPDPALQRLIVRNVHDRCPDVPIIARAYHTEDLPLFYDDGAAEVILPSFEGGMEILRQTLLRMGVTAEAIQSYTDAVHTARYEPWRNDHTDANILSQLRHARFGLELRWYHLASYSAYDGHTIGELNIRKHTQASIVAIVRNQETILNPSPTTLLHANDRLAVLCTAEQACVFVEWLRVGEEAGKYLMTHQSPK